MFLGESPKRPRSVGLVPFRPKRETLINKLPSNTTENTAITPREAILTLAATGAGASETVRITFTQSGAGARVLSAAPSSLTPTAAMQEILLST